MSVEIIYIDLYVSNIYVDLNYSNLNFKDCKTTIANALFNQQFDSFLLFSTGAMESIIFTKKLHFVFLIDFKKIQHSQH